MPIPVALVLGLSGCLLFTDPINKAPVVTIHSPAGPIYRGENAVFTVTVQDDRDDASTMQVRWAEFGSQNDGCGAITAASWSTVNPQDYPLRSNDAPYTLTPQTLDVICLCVQAIDHDGASTQPCVRVAPVLAKPAVTITDASGAVSGQARPLCSQIQLLANISTPTTGDQVAYNWTLQYSGANPAGKNTQLTGCGDSSSGQPSAQSPQQRCFYAGADGTYTASVTVTDSTKANGDTTSMTSDPASFEIPVSVDAPPCIQRTDPDVYAQRILLARSADVGGSYQSRTFTVLSVGDDCEPYPPRSVTTGTTTQVMQAHFVWSVYDPNQPNPSWVPQANTTNSFQVSQSTFPNARPGDTFGLRVEARDTPVEKLYQSGGSVCSDTTDICCGPNACTGTGDCIRWTTWTVQFQP